MLFKFGFDIIKNNKIMSIAIAVQLAISIVMLNYTIGICNNVFRRLNTISNFEHSDTIFYMSKDFIDDSDCDKIQNIVNDSLIEPIYSCGFVNDKDGINIFASAYGDITSQNISYKIIDGQWYESAKKEEGIINVVAFEGTDFKVGDVYETYLYNEDKSKMKSVKLKITGIVDRRIGIITSSMGSNSMETDILFDDVSAESVETNNWFILNYNDLHDIGAASGELIYSVNMFIYSDGNTEDYIKALSDTGNPLTLQNIIDNSSEVFSQKMHKVYPIATCVLLSGIFGAQCLLILNNLKNKKRFAILYICGMKWNDSIKISIIQLSYILVAVIPLSIIFNSIIEKTNIIGLTDIVMFDTNNIIITLCLIVLMYLISIITTKLMTLKTTPKDCLKNE